jgi:hypothetical protein
MRKIIVTDAMASSLACLLPAPAAQAVEGVLSGEGRGMHRIGFGANYWKTIDDIDEDFDSHGFSYIASYQYGFVPFVKFEAGLEILPDMAGASNTVLAPELFVTFGALLYAGAGIGVYYDDGEWGNAPFYMLRAGVDIPILPRTFLDISANYRFNDWDSLELSDVDSDTIRLGAMIRFLL